jgi:ParB-like chromosome segregation protein Spo0J
LLGENGKNTENYHPSKINTFMANLKDLIREYVDGPKALDRIDEIKTWLHEMSPVKQPINLVRWVDINKVQANDYNPNSVASKEMGLLYTSILHDGYTQPVVTIYDQELDKYIIVDGFHRYHTCKNNLNILQRNHGRLPIVVIDKNINDRMAATVRHNRARGSHSVTGMSSMVYKMLKNGWKNEDICNELGMEPEELLRLKHITGFSKLFANKQHSQAWKTPEMIKLEHKPKNHVG